MPKRAYSYQVGWGKTLSAPTGEIGEFILLINHTDMYIIKASGGNSVSYSKVIGARSDVAITISSYTLTITVNSNSTLTLFRNGG